MSLLTTLKEKRLLNNYTQEQLAQAVGVSRQTIFAIEQGNHTPSVELALLIARELNTTVETLFILQ